MYLSLVCIRRVPSLLSLRLFAGPQGISYPDRLSQVGLHLCGWPSIGFLFPFISSRPPFCGESDWSGKPYVFGDQFIVVALFLFWLGSGWVRVGEIWGERGGFIALFGPMVVLTGYNPSYLYFVNLLLWIRASSLGGANSALSGVHFFYCGSWLKGQYP